MKESSSSRPLIDVLRDLVSKWDKGYRIGPNDQLALDSRRLLSDMEATLKNLDEEIKKARKRSSMWDPGTVLPDDFNMFG